MKRILNVLTWAIRLFLFLFIFLFALKNSEPVVLQFFFGRSWTAPLTLMILAAFVAGVILGVLCMAGLLFRERRTSARLRRDHARAIAEKEAEPHPPVVY